MRETLSIILSSLTEQDKQKIQGNMVLQGPWFQRLSVSSVLIHLTTSGTSKLFISHRNAQWMEVLGNDSERSLQPVYILASSQAGQIVSGISTLEHMATKYGFLSFISPFLIPLLVFPESTELVRGIDVRHSPIIGHFIIIQKKSSCLSDFFFVRNKIWWFIFQNDALSQLRCSYQKTQDSS